MTAAREMHIVPIAPCPAPRQVRSDTWKPRPRVLRYRAFRDEVRARRVEVPNAADVTFVVPMPASWSNARRARENGQPHTQKPDLDNLLKALLDSVYDDDAHISEIHARKIWGIRGEIHILHPP